MAKKRRGGFHQLRWRDVYHFSRAPVYQGIRSFPRTATFPCVYRLCNPD